MKKIIRLCLSSIFVLVGVITWAQPATEVYLFDLQMDQGKISISNPVNISKHKGYDNQPHFLPDGCLYYVSSINGQTDVFHYERGQSTQITATPGGEYSPTPAPDGIHFSTILLEPDGRQLLWLYKLNGDDAKILIPDLVIGYHAWVTNSKLVSFVLGEPSTLQLSNLETGENTVLAENIGRSLHKIPGTDLVSYIQNKEDGKNEIRSYDISNMTSSFLVHALDDSQDVAWAGDGTLFMGQGSKLYFWKKGMQEWSLVTDLNELDLDGITRLAVGPEMKKLAIVLSEN